MNEWQMNGQKTEKTPFYFNGFGLGYYFYSVGFFAYSKCSNRWLFRRRMAPV